MFNKEECEKDTIRRDNRIGKMRAKIMIFDEDPKKEDRLKEQLCKSCYYVFNDSWAGQAFTESECKQCGQIMVFPTTDVDKYCLDCSKEYNVCKHCGGKID